MSMCMCICIYVYIYIYCRLTTEVGATCGEPPRGYQAAPKGENGLIPDQIDNVGWSPEPI